MTVAISSALQRSSLLGKRSADPDRVAAFMRGDIPTKPARQVVSSPFAKIPLRWERRSNRNEDVRRRRVLGGSSGLPDTIRHHYTEGERAALFVVGQEVKRKGFCDLCLAAIADRAGVGRTTVQNAMRRAQQLGHLTVRQRRRRGAKNLTNIVRVAVREWSAWLKRQVDRAAIGFKDVNTKEREDTLHHRDRQKTPPAAECPSSELVATAHGLGMGEHEAGCELVGAPSSSRNMRQALGKGVSGSFWPSRHAGNSGPGDSICEDKFES